MCIMALLPTLDFDSNFMIFASHYSRNPKLQFEGHVLPAKVLTTAL